MNNDFVDVLWAGLLGFFISMLPLIKTYIIGHFVLDKAFKWGAQFIRYAYRKNLTFVLAEHHYQNHNRKTNPAECELGNCRRIPPKRKRKKRGR